MYKFLLLFTPFFILTATHPIQFSISEKKMVNSIPQKDQDFAFLIPGRLDTYIYQTEADFYADYQRSFFAITTEKGGWDCLRHYEILANGCIPYFVNLENCPPNTMTLLPKQLILEAMHLPGVSYGKIDHQLFDRQRYFEILQKLLDYTHTVLSAKSIAQSILNTMNYKGTGKILFLTQNPEPDYLRCCTLIGFKELLGDRVIDIPKIEHIYTNYSQDVNKLYGKGFTYAKVVEDLPIDRSHIEERIANHEFDLIIYGSVHRGLPLFDLIRSHYSAEDVAYFCGEDAHKCVFTPLPHLFLREFR